MMKTATAAALSLALVVFTASAQRTPFTYDDMLMLDRIGGLSVSSTSPRALFTVRATDMEKNRGVRSLWLKRLDMPGQQEAKLPVGDAGFSDARWSPDGASIYFLSGREGGVNQLWRTDGDGRTAEQVTHLPLDVLAYRIMPDGRGAVVALAVFPHAIDDEVVLTVKRKGNPSIGSGTVYDKVFVRHWDEYADGTRNHLFHVDFATGKLTALTQGLDGDVPSKPFGDEGDFDISPDGATVWYSARIAGTTEPWSTNFDVFSVPVTGGPAQNLTEANRAWDASPRVSPDGKRIAFKAMKRPGFEADRFELRVMDLAGGTITPVAADWDRSVEQLCWSRDGQHLLVTADDLGKHRLFRVDLKTGAVTPLSKDGHMDAFVETAKGFVFLKSAMNSPSALYASNPKAKLIDDGATNLTQVNASLKEKEFGAYEQFSFPGYFDHTVHGYVVKPAGFLAGRKYPVAFLIHGGPQGSFGDMWSYRWNAQTYAGAGYAVVMIDFHGSTGYGQAFCDAITLHWGDIPLIDLQKGWDFVLKQYPYLDGDHAAALGASYGGFMVNWIASQWNQPWKCLVSHDGVFDQRSMGYTTEELWFTDWENGASVFDTPEVFDNFNPALFTNDWQKPMLIVHSELDHRIPVEQGIAAFTALQRNNVPSEFLYFPDENHWVLKPRNSKQWHDTVFGWLDRWTKRAQ